ncbi:Virus attachment protein p12 family protein [Acetitomaculum ruminis DSM 5522]|uniref:Virus attachment protein p12 family protein n=1 Tax=Acetitomaculum ruminis DSM 5522 TaxID=1120918 RepID=A0A1I0V1Y7_9FIRM|nr:FeoB-associated Cys-rich membrane protein [Acetitomaculum ruminis]SFA70090.1 Virus attachment protein p12 family protein [Acetitomaculum ruminis DSM 5522]
MIDILILFVLAIFALISIRKIMIDKKNGCAGCGGLCSSGSCPSYKVPKEVKDFHKKYKESNI